MGEIVRLHPRTLAERAFDRMPVADQRLVVRFEKLHAMYFESGRDVLFEELFGILSVNISVALRGKASKERIGVIIGASGSGKSTALRWHAANRPELQPLDEDGVVMMVCLVFDAPKPATPRSVMVAGLEAMGYVVEGSLTEIKLMELFRDLLKANGVLLCIIDEMQNVIRGNNRQGIKDMQEFLRTITQFPGWPMHVIVAGVETLRTIVNEKTLKNRRKMLTLKAMKFPSHCEHVRKMAVHIIEEDAELRCGKLLTDEFVHRLMHAAYFQFGSTIQLIRSACETAMRESRKTVALKDFAAAFAYVWDCADTHNVFLASDWLSIDTSMTEEESEAMKRRVRK